MYAGRRQNCSYLRGQEREAYKTGRQHRETSAVPPAVSQSEYVHTVKIKTEPL